MSNVFVAGFEQGWDVTGEGFNAEYANPRRPWAEVWAGMLTDAVDKCWPLLFAHNLTTALSLQRAYDLGSGSANAAHFGDYRQIWIPGCERDAP